MAALTTAGGVQITFDPDCLAAVAPGEDPGTAVVYGPAEAAVRISESPEDFLARLGVASKSIRLTRPDGSPVWIRAAAVSSLRATLGGEYAPNAHTVISTPPLRQAVREAPEVVQAALAAGGWTSQTVQSTPAQAQVPVSIRKRRNWLPSWLFKEENRQVAAFIGTGLAALVAGVWAVFVHFDTHNSGDETKPPRVDFMKTYRVCRGDNASQCMPESQLIGCTDYNEWARQHCSSNYDTTSVYYRPGGQCGYEMVTITCVAK